MEDPLFDPWSHDPPDEPSADDEPTVSDDEARAIEPDAPSRRSNLRWRSPPTAPRQPTSRHEVATTRVSGAAVERAQEATSRAAVDQAGPSLETTPGTQPQALIPAAVDALPAEGTPGHTLMRRVDWLVGRLRVAGHETVVDARLDEPEPSVRIRVTPSRSPLEAPSPADGSTLEIRIRPDADELVARLWPDPLAELPSREEHIAIERVDDTFVRRLLVDFVKQALQTA